MNSIYVQYGIFVLLCFTMYIMLDFMFFKIVRIFRNLFSAIIISFSMLIMNVYPGWGLILFVSTILFGDLFYYKYLVFKKPQKKEPADGSVL